MLVFSLISLPPLKFMFIDVSLLLAYLPLIGCAVSVEAPAVCPVSAQRLAVSSGGAVVEIRETSICLTSSQGGGYS